MLKHGEFNGRIITCTLRNRVFDARTGLGLSPEGCALEEYPLRIEDGRVQVDLSATDPT
jgi:toluene monooxygenase system ferredoxin subunit